MPLMNCARRLPPCRSRRSSSPARRATRREGKRSRTCRRGIARATRLAEQLLALSARSGATTVRRQCSRSICARCSASARRRVRAARPEERGVDLGIETSERASVTGDADALRVMFSNLIDNATQYTPGGEPGRRVAEGGRGASGRASAGQRAGHSCHGARSRVRPVLSRGEGREPCAHRRRRGQRGLGLAIVRHLALRKHGATVELGESQAGETARLGALLRMVFTAGYSLGYFRGACGFGHATRRAAGAGAAC